MCLPLLMERLRNEITRLTAVKVRNFMSFLFVIGSVIVFHLSRKCDLVLCKDKTEFGITLLHIQSSNSGQWELFRGRLLQPLLSLP